MRKKQTFVEYKVNTLTHDTQPWKILKFKFSHKRKSYLNNSAYHKIIGAETNKKHKHMCDNIIIFNNYFYKITLKNNKY